MENPTKMDVLGVPPFKETPICCLYILAADVNLLYGLVAGGVMFL